MIHFMLISRGVAVVDNSKVVIICAEVMLCFKNVFLVNLPFMHKFIM